MSQQPLSRRNLLSFLGGGAVAALSLGSAQAAEVVSAVKVFSGNGRALDQIAGYVEDELVAQLGNRYRPGAKGGLTVIVNLRQIIIPTADDAESMFDDRGGSMFNDNGHSGFGFRPRIGRRSVVDTLDARIEIRRGKTVVDRFPFFATNPTTANRFPYDGEADPYRLKRLAKIYVYWLIQKF
jgi:hypothetical protein